MTGRSVYFGPADIWRRFMAGMPVTYQNMLADESRFVVWKMSRQKLTEMGDMIENSKLMRVARILDCYTIAINHGADFGIRVGDTVSITQEVIDPDGGDSLGHYEKMRLRVSEVYPRFCIAGTLLATLSRAVVTVDVGDTVRKCDGP